MRFSSTPANMFNSLIKNRRLIYSLGSREVLGRYRGSMLGILWSLVNPIFMLTVYTFVFSVVFKARWNYGSDSKAEFALLLFSGLIIFNLFSECINRSPNLILSHSNYVKKMIFPLETLPWVVMISALFHAAISVGVWIIAYTLLIGVPSIKIIYLPLIFLPLMLLTIGLSWFLSSLGVYLRDVSQFVGVLTTMLLFMSPIFYPLSALPEKYHIYLLMNPLTAIVEQARDVMYWGKSPNWDLLAPYYIASGLIAWLGYAWFQKTRKGFADVL
ncbi:MAG: sugar ABC transporter permease [Pusillimonas sp.]|nr:sugar ABC transporter permease [Pusillimonas sp.]MBC43459.1 sugar ABC transporter permease [Pusillimonas sp.]HCP78473.1 sugar ABC transporter permease [Pusillimonas sp.]